MPETAEEISKQPEVRKELERTSGKKREEKVKAPAIDKFWFVTHGLLLIGSIKSRLIPKLLAALNAAPERVMFPKGDAR